ncbi:Hypothetical protein POVN_LOCUS347 [uncultured virus]|nr:Hypothetical protein POVN_LOCUS347 [uncultured virus]
MMQSVEIFTDLTVRLQAVATGTTPAHSVLAAELSEWVAQDGLESLKPGLVTFLDSKVDPKHRVIRLRPALSSRLGHKVRERREEYAKLRTFFRSDEFVSGAGVRGVELLRSFMPEQYDDDYLDKVISFLAGHGYTVAMFKENPFYMQMEFDLISDVYMKSMLLWDTKEAAFLAGLQDDT